MPHRGLVGLVHRDQPALVDGQPRAVDAERAHVGDAAGRHQHLVDQQAGAALELEPHTVALRHVAGHALLEAQVDAQQTHLRLELLGHLGVEEAQQPVAAVDERGLDAEGREDRGVLAADHEHHGELQPLGVVQRHQGDDPVVVAQGVLLGEERNLLEELLNALASLAVVRFAHILLRGGVVLAGDADQLLQVLEPPLGLDRALRP